METRNPLNLFLLFFFNAAAVKINHFELVLAHSRCSYYMTEKVLRAGVTFVHLEMLRNLLCSQSMVHSKSVSQLHSEQMSVNN